jgi:uncharacterized membrane protein
MRMSGRLRLALIMILLAGTALRLFHLGAGSLWYDETVSVFLAGSPITELLRHTAGDIHPPAYYLLLRIWLILAGYPTGHADPQGQGLELASALFSCWFGVTLIALAFWLAARLAGRRAGLVAALLLAASPYNVWYSQEVRMYTLGACLAVLATGAMYLAAGGQTPRSRRWWWACYAVAAAAGMYTLYYFAFLLVPINLWAPIKILASARRVSPQASAAANQGPAQPRLHLLIDWLLANIAVLVLYAPWLAVAWRQATQPPVPPWRTAVGWTAALREAWTALSLGQSAPAALWPAVLLLLPIYGLGLYAVWSTNRERPVVSSRLHVPRSNLQPSSFNLIITSPAALLALATFGALGLILLVSAITPLYHVRYVFIYSTFFYVALAAGVAWLWRRWRWSVALIGICWLAGSGITLANFWFDARYSPDDHRAAVAYLQAHWRPGDVVLVNAGYAYPALATYWQPALPRPDHPLTTTGATRPGSPIAWQGRLTGSFPSQREDTGLEVLTTGHVDGAAGLGWGDPRSDFFGMPATTALTRLQTLFQQHPRVWQYRIYDTVNDPGGMLRQGLDQYGELCEDQVFPGEASLRVQGWESRQGAAAMPAWPGGRLAGMWDVAVAPLPAQAQSGSTVYPTIQWQARDPVTRSLATSLRLIAEDGTTWAQPPDERVGGDLCQVRPWTPGQWRRQTLALPIPEGTPPGTYTVQLVAYDPGTGQPPGDWETATALAASATPPYGLILGRLNVERPEPLPGVQPAQATFGPLALLSAATPARQVSPGDVVPVELTWQALSAPGEPYVEVLQLLDGTGRVVAGLESQPVNGHYPAQAWAAGEIVHDRQTLTIPKDLPPGTYRLIAGLYRAGDGVRLKTRSGLWGQRDHYVVAEIKTKGAAQ